MRQTLTVTIGNSTTTYAMDFFYDASGYPFAVKYNGDLCYYITNLQGDVMSIVDAQGEVVAEYEYDPYGNIVSQSGPLADVNPLRYRGYVFDSETQFYYLQSRYYDPNLGRFINADVFTSTGQGILGNNMFAYCKNNAVGRTDFSGRISADINPNPHIYDKCGDSLIFEAFAIGERATISEGVIRIDMDAEVETILMLSEHYSLTYICDAIATAACEKYYKTYGVEFLLTEICVSYEIEEHIYVYYWATGRKSCFNVLAAGYCLVNLYNQKPYGTTTVYDATHIIDIKEKDAWDDSLFSQRWVFEYKDGIRD